jgi:subtilisin family serine protease
MNRCIARIAAAVFSAVIAIAPVATNAKDNGLEIDTVTIHEMAVAEGARYVPGEVLIQFREWTTGLDRDEARARVDAVQIEVIPTIAAHGQLKRLDEATLEVASVPSGVSVLKAIAELSKDPAVEFAEPNWIYTHDAASNDPYYTNGSLWGMYGDGTIPANQYGSQAGEAWAANHTGSSTVYVGIIDEGVMYNHVDLDANMWVNPHDAADGVDNDGNGYVDDVRGWDFDANDNTTFDGTQDDHGTHVAGTIGAEGGNGAGVAGVCWNVKMITGKFLGRRGGTTANAIRAVDYFTDLKNRHGLNIVATNNSWGGGGFSQGLQDAIERANAADILFIAAAGNDGRNNDTTASYPSGYPNANIIAVASITSTGGLSSFSNYGATKVDLGAPGSSINSTLPGRQGASGYGSYSGTSMATPHVTGGAALYASTHGGASAASIKSAILGAAVPTASLNGRCVTGGRLNVSGF